MGKSDISYKSYCWVIGTTSFRTAKLNLRIEEQLLLLSDFYADVCKSGKWKWRQNKPLQSKYYDFMKSKGFVKGEAKIKDKDAREKTSGLVDIGLIDKNRVLTSAGTELLEIAKNTEFEENQLFNISADSFVYLKQLLKTSIVVEDKPIRPFIVLLKCLNELEYLTYDEFTYLIPLIVDKKSATNIIESIKAYRKGDVSFEEIIFKQLMSMENYNAAFDIFLENETTEALICEIGINRKSRDYDKKYYPLYSELKSVFLAGSDDIVSLLEASKAIKHRAGTLWRKLIFESTNIGVVRKSGRAAIAASCPFKGVNSEEELKTIFFKYLHVYKALATLADYFDLNRRYFNLTETIIFEDRLIKLDMFPKYYFAEVIEDLFEEAFESSTLLNDNVRFEDISPALSIDIHNIYQKLSSDLGIVINTSEQAKAYITDERYRRFNRLIDEKFDNSVLLELLECFKKRDDKRIEALVTDEAAIPTIFEYVLGIIWYKVSERQGNILEFMKLSLEANLLPKTHAAGGYADIVYEYEACSHYPKHALLLEATLADGNNQRRMEMEPVSRHLGDYRIKFNNPFDYSLFVSTYLDKNVVSDFRYRKIIPYTRDDETIKGMKIISMDTEALKNIIKNKIKYSYLYEVFDKYHEMPLDDENWYDDMVREATEEYVISNEEKSGQA